MGNNHVKYMDMEIFYDSSQIKDARGLFSRTKLNKGDMVINIELINAEDPSFPLSEMLSLPDYEHHLDLFSTRYKTMKYCKYYNITQLSEFCFLMLDKIDINDELFLYKGIDYWLLESLKYTQLVNHLAWCRVAKKHTRNQDILQLVQQIEWRCNFIAANPENKQYPIIIYPRI